MADEATVVGRASIEVDADLTPFRERLQAEVDNILKGLKAEVPVGTRVSGTPAKAGGKSAAPTEAPITADAGTLHKSVQDTFTQGQAIKVFIDQDHIRQQIQTALTRPFTIKVETEVAGRVAGAGQTTLQTAAPDLGTQRRGFIDEKAVRDAIGDSAKMAISGLHNTLRQAFENAGKEFGSATDDVVKQLDEIFTEFDGIGDSFKDFVSTTTKKTKSGGELKVVDPGSPGLARLKEQGVLPADLKSIGNQLVGLRDLTALSGLPQILREQRTAARGTSSSSTVLTPHERSVAHESAAQIAAEVVNPIGKVVGDSVKETRPVSREKEDTVDAAKIAAELKASREKSDEEIRKSFRATLPFDPLAAAREVRERDVISRSPEAAAAASARDRELDVQRSTGTTVEALPLEIEANEGQNPAHGPTTARRRQRKGVANTELYQNRLIENSVPVDRRGQPLTTGEDAAADIAARTQVGENKIRDTRGLRRRGVFEHPNLGTVDIEPILRAAERGEYQNVFEETRGENKGRLHQFVPQGETTGELLDYQEALRRMSRTRKPFSIPNYTGTQFRAVKPGDVIRKAIAQQLGLSEGEISDFLERPEVSNTISQAVRQGGSLKGLGGGRNAGNFQLGLSNALTPEQRARQAYGQIRGTQTHLSNLETSLGEAYDRLEAQQGSGRPTDRIEARIARITGQIVTARRHLADLHDEVRAITPDEARARGAAEIVANRENRQRVEEGAGLSPLEKEDKFLQGAEGLRLKALIQQGKLPNPTVIANALAEHVGSPDYTPQIRAGTGKGGTDRVESPREAVYNLLEDYRRSQIRQHPELATAQDVKKGIASEKGDPQLSKDFKNLIDEIRAGFNSDIRIRDKFAQEAINRAEAAANARGGVKKTGATGSEGELALDRLTASGERTRVRRASYERQSVLPSTALDLERQQAEGKLKSLTKAYESAKSRAKIEAFDTARVADPRAELEDLERELTPAEKGPGVLSVRRLFHDQLERGKAKAQTQFGPQIDEVASRLKAIRETQSQAQKAVASGLAERFAGGVGGKAGALALDPLSAEIQDLLSFRTKEGLTATGAPAAAQRRARPVLTGAQIVARYAKANGPVLGQPEEFPAPFAAQGSEAAAGIAAAAAGGNGSNGTRPTAQGGDGSEGISGQIHVIVDNTPLPITWEGVQGAGAGPGVSSDHYKAALASRDQWLQRIEAAKGRGAPESEVERLRGYAQAANESVKRAERAMLGPTVGYGQAGIAAENRFRESAAGFRAQTNARSLRHTQSEIDRLRRANPSITDDQLRTALGKGGLGASAELLLPHESVGGASSLNLLRRRLGLDPIIRDITGPEAQRVDARRAALTTEAETAQRKILRRGFTASVTDVLQAPFFQRQNEAVDRFQRESSQLIRAYEDQGKAASLLQASQETLTEAQAHGNKTQIKSAEQLVQTHTALARAADKTVKEQEAIVESTRKNLPGRGAAVGNLAIGGIAAAGAFGLGSLVFQFAGEILSGVEQALMAAIGPAFERATGFSGTTNRVTAGLAEAISQRGGDQGAVAGAVAATGISAQNFAQISPLLINRAEIEAGNKALQQQIDLFHTADNLARQSGQGIPGLTQATGGFLGTAIGAVPSTAEQIGNELSGLVSQSSIDDLQRRIAANPAGSQVAPQGGPFGVAPFAQNIANDLAGKPTPPGGYLDPNSLKSLTGQLDAYSAANAAATKSLDRFNSQAEKGGSAIKLLADKSADAAKNVDDTAQAFKDIGADQKLIDAIKRGGLSLQGGGPINGATAQSYLASINRGNLTPSPELLIKDMERQLRAQIGVEDQQTRFNAQTQLPIQNALSNAFNPIGNIEKPLKALGTTLGKQYKDYLTSINEDTQSGLKDATNFIRDTFKGDAGAAGFVDDFTNSLKLAVGYAQQISKIQIGVETEQAAYQAKQYDFSISQTKRALQDAKGLTGDITAANKDNLGVLERQQFLLQRQSQSLSLELSQRQINFQKAIAGFAAPGLTGEERAARIKEAKIEAEYAQKQLDIQKKLFALGGKEFKITASRSVQDLARQLALLEQGKKVTLDTAAAEKKIQILTRLQQKEQAKVENYYQTAVQRTNDVMSLEAKLVAATGKGLNTVAEIAIKAFKTEYKGIIDAITTYNAEIATIYPTNPTQSSGRHAAGFFGSFSTPTQMTVGEAGSETVAVLRNPRTMSFQPTGSFGEGNISIHITVSGNTFQGGDEKSADKFADQLTDKIIDKLGRRAGRLAVR